MAEYTAPVHSPPDREFWNKTYHEFNARRKGSFYSAQQVVKELRNYAETRGEPKKPIRILEIGGADGEVLCEALKTVSELDVELITVVEPSNEYVNLYLENVERLNQTHEFRRIRLKPVVEGYDLDKLMEFHKKNGMECEYDIVLMIHVVYHTGLAAVPEIRDNFLKPETGQLVVICTHQSLLPAAQKFASDHYQRFYPSINPSTSIGSETDLLHFAIHDNCFMSSYQELFDVQDIVQGDDTASGNEKGRNFLRFLMQRDLGASTPAGELELRLYVKWVKSQAIPAGNQDLERDTANKDSSKCYMRENGIVLEGSFLACPITLFRMTSDSMARTLTAASAREVSNRRNQIDEEA